jgi:threonyl-tRNA synthetase
MHVNQLLVNSTPAICMMYKQGMFDQMDVEGEQYQIKPMNCPFHCLIYKDDLRSYRDLPIR